MVAPPYLCLPDGRVMVFVHVAHSGGKEVRAALGQQGEAVDCTAWRAMRRRWELTGDPAARILVGVVRSPREICACAVWRQYTDLLAHAPRGAEKGDSKRAALLWRAWEQSKEKCVSGLHQMEFLEGIAFELDYLLCWDTLERDFERMCAQLGLTPAAPLKIDRALPELSLLRLYTDDVLTEEETFYEQYLRAWRPGPAQ